MKVTEVKVHLLNMGSPAQRANRAWHPIICQVISDEGITGVGEAGIAFGTGAEATAGMIRDLASQFVVGEDPFRIEQIWTEMYEQSFWAKGGGPIVFAGISAIEEALWDLKGKALGLPVYEFLGGKMRDRVRVYANGWWGGLNSPEEYAEGAAKVVAAGYTALKMNPFWKSGPKATKVHPKRVLDEGAEDLAYDRAAAVREAVGPKVELMLEFHADLSTDTAIRMGRRFEDLRPYFYEEVVDPFNVDAMKKVSDSVNVRIATGERLYTRYGFRQYIEKQAVDVLQPDISNTGGIMETKKIAAMAEVYNMSVQPHNAGTPIATAASLQIDACISNFIIQEVFPFRDAEHYDLVDDAPERHIVDSYLAIPDRPGLGVELNMALVEKYPYVTTK